MFRWLAFRIRRILGVIIMKAQYWTAIGAMLIPVGAVVLIDEPDWVKLGLSLMIVGFISFIVGWGYTIREEQRNTAKEKTANEQRIKDDKWRDEQDKIRASSHYLDTLIRYEMLRALGVNPRRVSRRYRRWLADKEFQEQLKKYDEGGEEDEL